MSLLRVSGTKWKREAKIEVVVAVITMEVMMNAKVMMAEARAQALTAERAIPNPKA